MIPTLCPRDLSRGILTAVLLTAASLLSPRLPAQPATGSVEGRVFNAATASALINARVTLGGAPGSPVREAITDEGGAYRFGNVPAGEVRLEVNYLGLEPQSAVVKVPAGGSVQREFELLRADSSRLKTTGETVKLDAFTVVVDREMSAQAVAMNERRHAPNIKNVVAIDEFGDRGSENIGEFLLFLPGVSIETSGSEPTTVSMRGFPGNNTGLTIDGGELAGSFTANSRTLDLREVPMNNISRVEITKVPTPDMPAAGLGGSINLISRSGFESRKPKLSFNAYTMFHNSNGFTFDGGPRNHVKGTSPNYIQPSFDFSYLHPVNRNLAFTIGGSRTWRHKPMESGNRTDETPTWDLVRLVQTSSQWNSLAQVFKTLQGQIGVDWRISGKDTLSASFQYRDYDLYITRSVLGFAYGAGATGTDKFTQGAATGVGTVTMNGSGENVDVITEAKHYTLKYRHRGDVWRFDAAGAYSLSASDRPDIDAGFFNITPATLTNVILRGDDIPSSSGTIPTRYSATSRTGQAVDIYDGANYSLTSGTTNQLDSNTRKMNGRVDLGRDFTGSLPFSLKVGASIDQSNWDQRRAPKTWNFTPNGASDVNSRLAGRFDFFDEAFIAESPTVFGKKVRWISGKKVYELYKQRPEWFVEDLPGSHQNYVTNSREFTERISALYARGDLRLLQNRLWLVTGVRFERTDLKGNGPLNDINAQYQRTASGAILRNAAGQPVTITNDALALRKLRYVERGAHGEQDYSGYYPSLNATYNISDNLVLRAAYARSLGRPNISFIIPGTTITEPTVANPTITVNNVGLKPWTADSYDLSLESYHLKDGFGSIGIFQKSIKNFFTSVASDATPELLALHGLETDPSYANYDIVTRANGGDAKITGYEIGYRQSLTFLPHWARGFQVFVNATKLELSGSNSADFTGYNPKSLAGGINFVRPRYVIKATISHLGDLQRGAVAANATTPASTFNYQAKRTRIGLSAEYSISKRYRLYASATDVGGFVQDLQRYAPGTPDYAKSTRYQELGFYTNVGIRGSF